MRSEDLREPGGGAAAPPAVRVRPSSGRAEARPEERSPFLTAEWRDLAMVSFAIDPARLAPLVPEGTELDPWEGETLVSLVGFRFLDTRVLGVAVPWHRDFEEVNLRFYVRCRTGTGWERAVVFVQELVPRRVIAWTARAGYGEPYLALPMRHRIEEAEAPGGPATVSYRWRRQGRDEGLELTAGGAAAEPEEGSEAAFVTEHYLGITRQKRGRTSAYRVEHPRWRVRAATAWRVDCDVAALYGERFVEALAGEPRSAFLADGSAVRVLRRGPLRP